MTTSIFLLDLQPVPLTTDRFGLSDLRSAVLKSIGWLKKFPKMIKVYVIYLSFVAMFLTDLFLLCFDLTINTRYLQVFIIFLPQFLPKFKLNSQK